MKNTKMSALALCLVLVLAAACTKKEEPAPTAATPAASTPAATAFDPATGTANVNGKVSFEGSAPKPGLIRMNADPNCVALHKEPVYSQEVIVADGNLQNAFVYVKEGLEKYTFATPTEPAKIDQVGCQYVPHVGGVMVNQTLKIINSDATMHNIHCWANINPQFNTAQPIKGQETEKKFSTVEVMVPFRCDVHKWMSSYLGVLPHPYFGVTGKDGSYSLKNLPPGEYTIEAWHEKYGTQTQKVSVADRETKEANFGFKAS